MTDETYRRMSLLERLLPAAGFAIVALGGLIGSELALSTHREVSTMQVPSYFLLQQRIAAIDLIEILLLVAAMIVCAAGAVVSARRNFLTGPNVSPPGSAVLALGLLSLVVLPIVLLVLNMPYGAFGKLSGPGRSGELAAWIAPILLLSRVVAIFGIASQALFVLAPLKVRSMRRYSTPVIMIIFVVLYAVFSVVFALQWYFMTRPSVVY